MLPIFFPFLFFNSPLVILELCVHFMCLNIELLFITAYFLWNEKKYLLRSFSSYLRVDH